MLCTIEDVVLYLYYRASGFVSCTREEVVLYRVLERTWFCIVTTEEVALCHALLSKSSSAMYCQKWFCVMHCLVVTMEGCAIRKTFDTNKRQCRFNNNNDITARCHSTCLACM